VLQPVEAKAEAMIRLEAPLEGRNSNSALSSLYRLTTEPVG
jgi:hypothetical protein